MIKKISLVILLTFVNVFSVFATPIDASINSIIKKVDPDINMGMMVVDLSTGKTLYQRSSQKEFTPASNMKLFSEAAALMLFGPAYNFRTTLSTDAKYLHDGVLDGSIYLHLVGDPSFTQEDLADLFTELPNWGIKKISGDFVIISSNSKISPHAPGTDPKDYTHGYGAPVAPLMLDENRVIVTVNPSSVGRMAEVEYSAKANSFVLDNKVKTVSQGRCGVSAKVTKANHLRMRGCVYKNAQSIQIQIPIVNPLSYAKSVVKNRLNLLGIQLSGKVVLGSSLKPTFFLAAHNSKPITQLMANTLKRSDNLYADSLFLHTAQAIQGKSLSWQQSEQAVKGFLQKQTGINMQRAVLIDGSGLSTHDLVTPLQTISLLKYIHSHFPLAYEYISALPIAGQDGTLWRRFRKPNQRGFLRAKTGTLTGVISLSGYLYSANGHTLAFAIYINRRPGTKPNVSGRYMSMVDTLCSYLLSSKPEGLAANIYGNRSTIAFQQRPSKDDKARSAYAKWRGIEKSLKQHLQSQDVALLFRNNKILIVDKNNNATKVWLALQEVAKKYSFSVGLKSKDSQGLSNRNILLWQDQSIKNNERTWYLQELVS
jgi:D-alanyl-D-alanine carboxypeptidase/D-alanyl-D-alanine-endopeptidase (penicillin-binding protein 4)